MERKRGGRGRGDAAGLAALGNRWHTWRNSFQQAPRGSRHRLLSNATLAGAGDVEGDGGGGGDGGDGGDGGGDDAEDGDDVTDAYPMDDGDVGGASGGSRSVAYAAAGAPPPPSPAAAAARPSRDAGVRSASVTRPPPPAAGGGLLAFLGREMNWGSALKWSSTVDRAPEAAATMFRVPYHLESFLWFGNALAVDLFLFHFTLLPLRFLRSLAAAAWQGAVALTPPVARGCKARAAAALPLTRAAVYDIIKGAVLLAATLVLGSVQVSRVYHYIRGEAIIKLYVIFNILEVVDKLCASLGSDILDTLHRTVRDSAELPHLPSLAAVPVAAARAALGCGAPPQWRLAAVRARAAAALLAQVALAVVYVTVHAAVIFVQIVCLTVAVNSKSSSLLTLLVSNNFVELKGSVFKRFEPENLFQVACADAVERAQLLAYMCLIVLQEGASAALLASMVTIWVAEVGVDWVKHAFVSKFNRLPPELYGSFAAILAHDTVVVRSRMHASMDPTHAGVRRLGMAALPLTTVVLRMALTKVHPSWYPRLTAAAGAAAVLLAAACLLAAKMLLSMLLLARSAHIIAAQRAQLASAALTSPPRPPRPPRGGAPRDDARRAADVAAAIATAATAAATGTAAASPLASAAAAAAAVPATPYLRATPLLRSQYAAYSSPPHDDRRHDDRRHDDHRGAAAGSGDASASGDGGLPPVPLPPLLVAFPAAATEAAEPGPASGGGGSGGAVSRSSSSSSAATSGAWRGHRREIMNDAE